MIEQLKKTLTSSAARKRMIKGLAAIGVFAAAGSNAMANNDSSFYCETVSESGFEMSCSKEAGKEPKPGVKGLSGPSSEEFTCACEENIPIFTTKRQKQLKKRFSDTRRAALYLTPQTTNPSGKEIDPKTISEFRIAVEEALRKQNSPLLAGKGNAPEN